MKLKGRAKGIVGSIVFSLFVLWTCGCATTWMVIGQPVPAAMQNPPNDVRVTTGAGVQVILHEPRLENDTITGTNGENQWRIAVSDVRSVELPVYKVDPVVIGLAFIAGIGIAGGIRISEMWERR